MCNTLFKYQTQRSRDKTNTFEMKKSHNGIKRRSVRKGHLFDWARARSTLLHYNSNNRPFDSVTFLCLTYSCVSFKLAQKFTHKNDQYTAFISSTSIDDY